VVQDVPPGLEQCETCREVDCSQERWASCEHRLETEAIVLRQRRTDAVLSAPAGLEGDPAKPSDPVAAKPKPVSS